MKHLYIIGNGFDIYTGLKTRYVDFCLWLKNNNPFIYENLQAIYDINAEWWNDFEIQLGRLNIKKYIQKFSQKDMCENEILTEIERKKKFEEKYNNIPNLYFESHCAKRLRGILEVLQYCFEKWVNDCQRSIIDPKYIHVEKEAFFINFNYTDVLEVLYKIPEEQVLHIHGRASKQERLIYGHNMLLDGKTKEEEQVCFELRKYNKNPYEYIYKYYKLKEILKNIEYVHIYGFSFSPVDEDYMDWFFNNISNVSQWEVSYFTNTDKERIEKFVLNHYSLKRRLNIIKLDNISKK